MPNSPETHIDGGSRTVELFVRSLTPRATRGRLEELVEHLEMLETRGRIQTFEVHVWGARIDRTSAAARTEVGQFVTERVEAISEWACENDFSLGSFFQEEPVESSITGEEYTATALPTATLAEYVDDELAFVTPCSDGETTYTVEDRLDALRGNGRTTNGPAAIQTQTN